MPPPSQQCAKILERSRFVSQAQKFPAALAHGQAKQFFRPDQPTKKGMRVETFPSRRASGHKFFNSRHQTLPICHPQCPRFILIEPPIKKVKHQLERWEKLLTFSRAGTVDRPSHHHHVVFPRISQPSKRASEDLRAPINFNNNNC